MSRGEKERKQILLVEDEATHVDLIKRAFKSSSPGRWDVDVAETLADARERLATHQPPDLILLDYLLPDGAGLDLLGANNKDNGQQTFPVVVLTSHGSEEVAVEAIKRGALDYVIKSSESIADLPHMAERTLEHWEEIQARKQAEEELKAAREYAQSLIDSSLDMIISVDQDRRIVEFNQAAQKTFGYSKAELLDQPINILYADPAEGLKVHETVRRTGRFTGEIVNKRKNDEVFPAFLAASVLRDANGEFVGVMGVSQDITERKRAEDRIRSVNRFMRVMNETSHLEELMSAILEQAIDMIPNADSGSFLLLNEQENVFEFRTARGWNLELLKQIKIPADRTPSIQELFNELTIFEDEELELLNKRCYGPEIVEKFKELGYPKSLILIPVHINGEMIGFFNINSKTEENAFDEEDLRLIEEIRDEITLAVKNARLYEQVKLTAEELERQVRERTAQLEVANRELEWFSYAVSHDLRAPLRAIESFSTALLEDFIDTLDEQGRHYLERIQAGSQKMFRLIDSLLTLSQLGEHEIKRRLLNLTVMAWEVNTEMAEMTADHEVDFQVADGLKIVGDPQLIKIVLTNLISNALKFTRGRTPAVIRIGSMAQNGQTVFFVQDNGVGFDMAFADKLFRPFQRLHRPEEFEGAGIGLASVQRIIHRHGGRVWAEAVPDEGATFFFTCD
ncbi:MAG: PAS domain S-box protein [Candidatus Bipolaricaulia bacterium]